MSPSASDSGVLMGYPSRRLESSLKVYGGEIEAQLIGLGSLVTSVTTRNRELIVTRHLEANTAERDEAYPISLNTGARFSKFAVIAST